MDPRKKLLIANVESVYDQVRQACQAAGRSWQDVKVLAVTKYVDVQLTAMLAECLSQYLQANSEEMEAVVPQLGESRAQLLTSKIQQWDDSVAGTLPVQWHFIGPMQSNKIGQVAPVVSLLQSVDRLSLLNKLENFCASEQLELDVLLEFNISGDAAKHGFDVQNWSAELEPVLSQLKFVRPIGLMGMSGLESETDQKRQEFQRLTDLLPQVRSCLIKEHRASFQTLSMGMSGDLKEAIAAGSTMVRIGSAFFEGLR